MRVDTDAGTVKRVHGWAKSGYSNEIVSVDIASVPWCTDKILAGKACHFSGLHELPDEAATDRDFYESLGFRSRFNVPVFVDNRVAGSVSFVMLREERKWTEEIRNELSLFARVGVTAWHRIEGMRLIEERDAELLRSQRVAHVGSYHVEMAETGAPLKDSAGIVTLSDEARAMFQIDAGGESFDLIVSRVHPEDRQLFETSIGSLGARDSVRQYDYRVIRPDGSTIHVEDRLQADRDDDGEIIRVFGTIMDVTDRVESNLQLKGAMEEIEQLKDQLQDENIYLRKEVRSASRERRLIGENPQFVSALVAADKVAPTDVTVLILGETGTGKELVAREIHQNSIRSGTPLVSVNCAALSSELIESELFGHEAGAFTGADKARKGRFELADGGTLFLDEIGDLPADVQAKILRALQTGEFERLGGMRTLKVDVRLITATNRNLQDMVREETFRADLFYRINSFPIVVPALRERKDDIALLAN
ncbi:MAG: sigma 54-interacting transcriptional regulator, partial [Woeseiaceae bacterium]